MDEAESSGVLHRVGRSPDPLAWPPANVRGRYNDPDGRFRVLYAASERRAAFLETLQTFRPSLQDLVLVASPRLPSELDLPFPIGRIPVDYFDRRIATFHLDRTQRWLDVRSPRSHAQLRRVLASELVIAGYAGAFNFGEIIGSGYTITQAIARWAYEAGHDPLIRRRRFHRRLGVDGD